MDVITLYNDREDKECPGWGAMVARGRDYLLTSPHMALFPILALTVMVISLNGAGKVLSTRFDARARYS